MESADAICYGCLSSCSFVACKEDRETCQVCGCVVVFHPLPTIDENLTIHNENELDSHSGETDFYQEATRLAAALDDSESSNDPSSSVPEIRIHGCEEVISSGEQPGTSSRFKCKRHRTSSNPPHTCSRKNKFTFGQLYQAAGNLTESFTKKKLKGSSSKSKKLLIKDVDKPIEEILQTHPLNQRIEVLLDKPEATIKTQIDHTWNPDDSSFNIVVKESDSLTLHRHPVAQSTDCIRGKVGYERGVHLFEITWPTKQRGTHAVVGVCTAEAPLHSTGYHSLLGSNDHSWGWDLGRGQAIHNSSEKSPVTYPVTNVKYEIPEKFQIMLDMDQGVLGFIVNGKYFGPAFTGLHGKKLFVSISAVWGHCEVTLKYLGGLESGPLSLSELCRHVIRQNVSKPRIQDGSLQKLYLPKTLIKYLEFTESSWYPIAA